MLADPHVKRAYLGEEDQVLVDPDDPGAGGDRGMMDYAGARRSSRHLSETARGSTRKEHGGEIALREAIRALEGI